MPNSRRSISSKLSRSPRLDNKYRLLSRFYEPLVLLRTLGQTRGQHVSHADYSSTETSARRQFLNDLAFMCDFEKGGDTVTAAAIQNLPEQAIIWIAANTNHDEKVVKFISSILRKLKGILPNTTVDKAQVDLIAFKCIEFNKNRIKAYKRLLQKHVQQSLEILKSDPNHKG